MAEKRFHELRTKLDAAIYNKHGGGAVSSRWTVDSILDAVMPIIESQHAADLKLAVAMKLTGKWKTAQWVWENGADAKGPKDCAEELLTILGNGE